MTINIIQDRLKEYDLYSKQEELNALKEIYQEIALCGLARTDFFKKAAFQGGTCLRIIHHLRRFSEDLDFMLLKPDEIFKWNFYLEAIEREFRSFGVEITIKELEKDIIKTALLKETSFNRILELRYDRLPSDEQIVKIKLEIDTNPPLGSFFETAFLIYPYPFSILLQDLPSLFASKCHALLCRPFVKGRDWFDFLWYISKKTPINLTLLKNAIEQMGPYKNKKIIPDKKWLIDELGKKIISIDWEKAKRDVENFLTVQDKKMIESWSQALFLSQLEKIQIKD